MNKEQQIEEMAIENLVAFLWHNTNMYDEELIFDVAEALVNAGYRKQSEWISVDERLPEESGYYLTYNAFGNRTILPYSTRHKRFNCWDCLKKNRVDDYSINVTHWMPLPEVPKGE